MATHYPLFHGLIIGADILPESVRADCAAAAQAFTHKGFVQQAEGRSGFAAHSPQGIAKIMGQFAHVLCLLAVHGQSILVAVSGRYCWVDTCFTYIGLRCHHQAVIAEGGYSRCTCSRL